MGWFKKLKLWFANRKELLEIIRVQDEEASALEITNRRIYETALTQETYYVNTVKALVMRFGGEVQVSREICDAVIGSNTDVQVSYSEVGDMTLKLVEAGENAE